MGSSRGFTLIELLIVVAIIGVLVAISVPYLLRARISANEAATVGDIRSVLSAEVAYSGPNGGNYGDITCLADGSLCCPACAGSYLDPLMSQASQVKSGYNRTFNAGPPVGTMTGAIAGFTYEALPLVFNQTGIRAFCGDASGIICFTTDGTALCSGAFLLPAGCPPLQ